MPRSVAEWIGKTDNTPVPPRVKMRIFERHNGRCYLTVPQDHAGRRVGHRTHHRAHQWR
jgi:5-methylcytosine-specific restriction protein A